MMPNRVTGSSYAAFSFGTVALPLLQDRGLTVEVERGVEVTLERK